MHGADPDDFSGRRRWGLIFVLGGAVALPLGVSVFLAGPLVILGIALLRQHRAAAIAAAERRAGDTQLEGEVAEVAGYRPNANPTEVRDGVPLLGREAQTRVFDRTVQPEHGHAGAPMASGDFALDPIGVPSLLGLPRRNPAELRGFATELAGEYEVERELGRGGMAVVYLARERALGREVALKVLRTDQLQDPEALQRFAREARAVAQLTHPHVVTLYGLRQLTDGSLVLVMQYVAGGTLKDRIRREGPLPIAVVVRYLGELASALGAAHRRGIVHRDLKPENVYIDADTGSALLADFGIAHAADSATLTLTGTAIGTPAYMSPEQIDGGVIDGRSDLYSWGLLGYEMLTGEQPWAGETLYTIIYKQKHNELPPVQAQRPEVPPALATVLARALRKQPDERWPSADAALAELGDIGDIGLRRRPHPAGVNLGVPERVEATPVPLGRANTLALNASDRDNGRTPAAGSAERTSPKTHSAAEGPPREKLLAVIGFVLALLGIGIIGGIIAGVIGAPDTGRPPPEDMAPAFAPAPAGSTQHLREGRSSAEAFGVTPGAPKSDTVIAMMPAPAGDTHQASQSIPGAADVSVTPGVSRATEGISPPVGGDSRDPAKVYFEFQVEKQVQPFPGNLPPHYPDSLREVGVEGEVLAQFVVDTTGTADTSTFEVLKSTHRMFSAAVAQALMTMRFYPAEWHGRKVKQLVQMPFQFTLPK